MAKSNHSTVRLSAAERWERRAERRPVPSQRRTGTRRAVVAAALAEV